MHRFFAPPHLHVNYTEILLHVFSFLAPCGNLGQTFKIRDPGKTLEKGLVPKLILKVSNLSYYGKPIKVDKRKGSHE